MPHQDLRGASASSARATAGSPDPGRDARRAGSRATPVTPTKSRAASSLTPLSDEQSEVHETQPDPLDLISGAQDDDQKTELADEDGEEYDEPPPTKGSRKRKRAASAAPKAALRASMRASKAPSAADSIARLPKRGRGPSASRRSSLTLPTRVFARWDNLMWFYSGVVRERGESSTQFVIDFDDETHCPVELKNIRRGLLQAGDSVKVVNPELHGTVVEADEERATLQMQDGGERVEPVANIMVHARAITGLWGGRVLALEDIVPRIQPRALADTPSPSKASVLSAASAKHARSRVLAHIGFVVTLSAGCPKRQKADIEQVIRAHGGTVLEDWSAIFPLATEYAAGKKRWIAKAGGLHTKKLKDGISQVFLISDKMNQKPKYLVALALGIPCLSAEFLKSALTSDDVKHWARYLLPAGSSETLNACLSQLVDLDWGATPEHLTDIMKNSVAPKIFAGKSILVVGAEYFPVPPALRGKKEEGESSVPRIIVSMGADRVEAVPELRYASPKVEFDYVIWPKLDEDEMDEMEESWVSFPWVKDCLVAGRLLPLPQL
ncbi:hypothetical protein FA95DRAFT_43641 [Auriscalpium vulgare]|uniref:Uncharacterized protein n=1 Tax=Auriscalpium vulgare TaxID=40419 RepID=A0ACB8SCF0_9AGAM|nr:hypothetical protein FA95DRAFT_43641 [Auriscalpium vulgare]